MGLLARDRTQVSWLGVYCSSMERVHSWSRCVYNYTLGNRILSVYKRRMFWQLLGFFASSLRKQLWIPSWLLPLAGVGALEHPGTPARCPQAPRPLELALSRDASLAFLTHAALEAPTAPAVSPPPSLCRCAGGDLQPTAGALQKLNERSRWPGVQARPHAEIPDQ